MDYYEMAIEIAAMNRPLGEDDLLKAAVAGEVVWKTVKSRFLKPFRILRGFSDVIEKWQGLSRAEYARGRLRSYIRLGYTDIDANNLFQIFRDGAVKASTRAVPKKYGDEFCKLFKCAAKVTVVSEDGACKCSWYSPDGHLNRDTDGKKGEPSKSLDDFIREWDKAR